MSVASIKQHGAVLILLAFIIGLGALVYLLQAQDPKQLRLEQDKKTMQNLSEAKAALLSWAVSNSFNLGQMPYPDRNSDGNYDGSSDCPSPASTFSYSFLIGQLPVYEQTTPCISPLDGLGIDPTDAQGNKLWYAVSRNVVHEYGATPSDPIINPSIIDNPTYPWLKVLDRNGALVSGHVVAVIIAPGNPLSTQNRTVLSPASEFLDTFKIGATSYSNADYTKPDEDFIMGEDSRNVSSADTTFVQPYNFNDKLVYITIDELIAALNNRAAAEAKNLLNQYKAKTGQFPYAAPLGAALNNNISVPPNQKGMLPIDATDNCSCADFQNCTCDFKPIINVTFTKNSGTWQSANLACTISGNKCICTGMGSCTRGAINFTCTSAGVCTTNQIGVNLFTYTIPSYADATPDGSAGCFLSGSNPACNSAGGFAIGLKESDWFKKNLWQDYFYYEWSSTANLQVGGKAGISAILVATGQAIVNPPFTIKGSAQTRPSNMITDYLDSAENTNGDAKFDATNQPKSANYNDQVYIVAP